MNRHGRAGDGRTGGGAGRSAPLAAGLAMVALVSLAMAIPASGQDRFVRVAPSSQGWLGIGVEMQPRADGTEMRSNGRRGESVTIVIVDVFSGSPADSAGLEIGDTLVRIEDRPATRDAFESFAAELEVGDRVTMTVMREGRERQFEMVAGQRPQGVWSMRPSVEAMELQIDSIRTLVFRNMDSLRAAEGDVGQRRARLRVMVDSLRGAEGGVFTFELDSLRGLRSQELRVHLDSMQRHVDEAARALEAVRVPRGEGGRFMVAGPDGRVMSFSPMLVGQRVVAGAQMIEMNPGLAEYFDVHEGGLLVTEVIEGSPAHDAGLRAGDVITEMNDVPVRSLGDVRGRLSGRRGESTTVEVVRRGEPLTLTVPE